MNTNYAFGRPLYVMLKPVGAACNMRCEYCYYLEKSKLVKSCSPAIPRREGESEDERGEMREESGGRVANVMSDELLERFVREYIESQTTPEIMFTWHGGEPLLRSIDFYKKVLKLQRIYARGRRISNSIQTNGTLLNDEWCRFLRDNNFLVGVSIDGPKEFHDAYRHFAGGRPSFDRVMRGIELLKKHGVEWNGMAVVNNLNSDHPKEFYQFFKQIGCKYLQFTPIVERVTVRKDGLNLAPGMQEGGCVTDYSVTPEQWGKFLCGVFDEWVRNDVGEIFVQLFDATLANWVGVAPGICTMSRQCGHAAVMEHNGDVYSCDHFVFPDHWLGNLKEKTITEMMYSEKQREFARMKSAMLPRQCRECRFLFACNGECPKNRFVSDCYGEPFLNYLCRGYREFFSHSAPYFDYMKGELSAGRPPSNVMKR